MQPCGLRDGPSHCVQTLNYSGTLGARYNPVGGARLRPCFVRGGLLVVKVGLDSTWRTHVMGENCVVRQSRVVASKPTQRMFIHPVQVAVRRPNRTRRWNIRSHASALVYGGSAHWRIGYFPSEPSAFHLGGYRSGPFIFLELGGRDRITSTFRRSAVCRSQVSFCLSILLWVGCMEWSLGA